MQPVKRRMLTCWFVLEKAVKYGEINIKHLHIQKLTLIIDL